MNNYKKILDEFSPTPDNETFINTVIKKAEVKKSPKKRIPRLALISAIFAILIFTLGASAYVIGNGELFKDYFSNRINPFNPEEKNIIDDETIELLNECSLNYTASVTDNGTTVDVLGIVGDIKNIFVIFEVTPPEGVIFEENVNYYFDDFFHDFQKDFTDFVPYSTSISGGTTKIKSGKLLIEYSIKTSLNLSECDSIGFSLKDFCMSRVENNHQRETIASGEWKFEFKPDFPDLTRTFALDLPADSNNECFNIFSTREPPEPSDDVNNESNADSTTAVYIEAEPAATSTAVYNKSNSTAASTTSNMPAPTQSKDGIAVTIKKIEASPFSLSVDYSTENLHKNNYLKLDKIILNMADGEEKICDNSGGAYGDSSVYNQSVFSFLTPINPYKIESVTIGDLVISLI